MAGLERGFSRKAAITWRLESHGALWSSVNNSLDDNTFHSEPTSTDDTHAHAGRLFSRGNDSGGIDISEAIFTGSLASQFRHHRQRCGRKREENHTFQFGGHQQSQINSKARQTRFFLISTIEWRPEPLASLCHFRPDIPFRQNSKFPVSTIPIGIH